MPVEEGEFGASEPVAIVEATDQEIQPEDEEQALALNADGLRFWLNEVLMDNMKLEKQLQLSKQARSLAAEMCRTGKPQPGLTQTQPPPLKTPRAKANNNNRKNSNQNRGTPGSNQREKRKADEADLSPEGEPASKRQEVEGGGGPLPGDVSPAAWAAALEASMHDEAMREAANGDPTMQPQAPNAINTGAIPGLGPDAAPPAAQPPPANGPSVHLAATEGPADGGRPAQQPNPGPAEATPGKSQPPTAPGQSRAQSAAGRGGGSGLKQAATGLRGQTIPAQGRAAELSEPKVEPQEAGQSSAVAV